VTAALASSALPSTHASTPESQPVTHPAVATAAPPAANTKVDPKNTDAEKSDVTVRNLSNAKPKAAEMSTAPLKLVIRATETSWISVLADGQPASQETLIAPAHASIRANREIVARIGNAAGVTFLWNGQEISADGAEGEVKTFVFDGNGMRVVPTAQPASQNQ
jgi:hypothetical protein